MITAHHINLQQTVTPAAASPRAAFVAARCSGVGMVETLKHGEHGSSG
jgi:hypothetical protein